VEADAYDLYRSAQRLIEEREASEPDRRVTNVAAEYI